MKVTGLEPYVVRVRFVGPTLPYAWSGGRPLRRSLLAPPKPW